MNQSASAAIGQRSFGDPNLLFPLYPPLLHGCPRTSTPEMQYPLRSRSITEKSRRMCFWSLRCPGSTAGRQHYHRSCLTFRWVRAGPLSSLVAGLPFGSHPQEPIWLKDESRNPTWSHKDRLNYCIYPVPSRRARLGSRLPLAAITAPPPPLTRAGPVCVASSFPVRVRRRRLSTFKPRSVANSCLCRWRNGGRRLTASSVRPALCRPAI